MLTPRSDIKAGAARVQVHAPLEVVRKAVTNYDAYGELHPPLRKGEGRRPSRRRDRRLPSGSDFEGCRQGVGRHPLRAREGQRQRRRGRRRRPHAEGQREAPRCPLAALQGRRRKRRIWISSLLIVPDWVVPVPNSLVEREASSAAQKAVKGLSSLPSNTSWAPGGPCPPRLASRPLPLPPSAGSLRSRAVKRLDHVSSDGAREPVSSASVPRP